MKKTSDSFASEHLKNQKTLARYLSEAFKTGRAEHAVKAIGAVARAKGMSALARQTKLERVNLYRSLYYREKLKLSIAMRLLDAFDMQLVVVPKKQSRAG